MDNLEKYLELKDGIASANENFTILEDKIKNIEVDRELDLSYHLFEIEEAIQKLNIALNNTLEKIEYKKEHVLDYVREALLDDKISFEQDLHFIKHAQAVEMDALKDPNIYREYAKPTEATKTFFILSGGENKKCYDAYDREFTYGVCDNFRGHSLHYINGEELCCFEKDESKVLRQDLSIIEINGEKVLCLKVSSFYPYTYIDFLTRWKIFYALSRLLRKNPNLVSSIIEKEEHSLDEQNMLLQKN